MANLNDLHPGLQVRILRKSAVKNAGWGIVGGMEGIIDDVLADGTLLVMTTCRREARCLSADVEVI